MSFIQLVQARRSVRKFLDKPVDRELILQCVEAARLAPSAENVQPWRFLILDDAQVKRKFCEENFVGLYRVSQWAERAPVLVVLLAERDILANRIGKQITGIHYYLIDMGISGEHFVLQAAELGLATCWIGWFSPDKARKSLNLPGKYQAVALLALGYPAEGGIRPLKRRDQAEICRFNAL
jgi:nitroreductase